MGKVFSREKYIQTMGENMYRDNYEWVDECDGEPVKNGRCGIYRIVKKWCIDVPDAKEEPKKVYTMKDFREKPIAVRVGQKHVKEFLQICEAEGLRWNGGEKATEFVPPMCGSFVIALHCKYGNGKLLYGRASTCKEHGMTIVDFADIAKQPVPARYKITIECDGTTTTARMEVNGKEVKAAQARLNPKDKFSLRTGMEYAFRRLWDKGAKKKPAEGVREVKRPAEAGEWVKIVAGRNGDEQTYKNGDIRCVARTYFADCCGTLVSLEGETCTTDPSEYVVLEGYKPERGSRAAVALAAPTTDEQGGSDMDDLISREWVLKRLQFAPDADVVKMAPRVDAADLAHAHWKYRVNSRDIECAGKNGCHEAMKWLGDIKENYFYGKFPDYCPHCGAKMDEGVHECC